MVGIGRRTPTRGRRIESIDHLVTIEDMVTTSWEEAKLQLEELENEDFLEEWEDNFDIIQLVSKKKKPYQSSFSFDCEDMASLYGSGREQGMWGFSDAADTIEVEDFKEFTMWYELQKSHNSNFNPYMVWRALFWCME